MNDFVNGFWEFASRSDLWAMRHMMPEDTGNAA